MSTETELQASPVRAAGYLCGLVGPLLFFAGVLTAASLRTEFSFVHQFISELGERGSASEPVMNYVGLIAAGAFVMGFSLSLFVWRASRDHGVASALVAGLGAAMIATGFISCDPTCTLVSPSAEQLRHNLTSLAGWTFIVCSPLAWGGALWRSATWRRFAFVSFAVSAFCAVVLFAFLKSNGSRYPGLHELLIVTPYFIWMAAFALLLLVRTETTLVTATWRRLKWKT